MLKNTAVQKKILLVDDDKLVREVLSVHLTDAGFLPVQASSAAEAWQLLNEGKPLFAVAIVDRIMPEEDGTQLIKRIKSNPVFKHMPVIMLTAAAEPGAMVDAVQGGAFDFLLKPIEKDLLLMVVKRAIGIAELGA